MLIRMQPSKADLVGIAFCLALSMVAIFCSPVASWAIQWQGLLVIVPLSINLWIWKKERIPPMPIRKASWHFLSAIAVVVGVAALDTVLGFLFGAPTVVEAFLNSGPAGAPVDIFLAMLLVFIGIPTVVRSLVEFYVTKPTSK